MANVRVRLTKRVKITDVYSKALLSELSSSRVSPEDFQRFLISMAKMPWRYCPVAVDATGRYSFGRVKLPGIKDVDGPEVDVDRKSGSYHLDYRENGVRSCPTVVKVLNDHGRATITSENLSPHEITVAIGIVERRLNAIRQGDIVPDQKVPKKLKGARVPFRDHIRRWLLKCTSDPDRVSSEEALSGNSLSSYRLRARNVRGFLYHEAESGMRWRISLGKISSSSTDIWRRSRTNAPIPVSG